jgi:hypothetical protein
VPSVDTLASAIRAALDQTRHLIAAIAASSESAAECRDQVTMLGVARSADQLGTTVDRIEEGQAQAQAMAERLEAALAAVEAARTGAKGGGGRGMPPTSRTPDAPSPGPHRSGPNLARAEFDDRKLTKYALNPEHPVGGNKARVIKSRTGLGIDDAAEVKRQILEKAPAAEPIKGDTDEHGTRWKVDVELTGPDGTMKVRTGWITDTTGKTRLVTISFPPKGER